MTCQNCMPCIGSSGWASNSKERVRLGKQGPLVSWLCSFHLSLSLNAAAASQLWPLQVWGMVRTEQSQVSKVEGLAALIVHTGWKVWAFGGWWWGPQPTPNLPHPWLVFKLSRVSPCEALDHHVLEPVRPAPNPGNVLLASDVPLYRHRPENVQAMIKH